jgi:hypothetical protein
MLRQMIAAGRCGTAISSAAGGYSFDYAAASVNMVPGPIAGAALPGASSWRAVAFSVGGDGVSGLLEQKPFGIF